MSAIGSSADNALTESFNATFKRETLQSRKYWSSQREARLDAFDWLTNSSISRSSTPFADTAAADSTASRSATFSLRSFHLELAGRGTGVSP
ncbi:hypothetical protein ACFY3N_34740 [Streptomyces sp. NPDC000348]|uniref:hypothetical protein n=1 Tax=Streptomyces sp. NPDC000348 TaxID=3364538 RepID=UPI0036AFE1AA